MQEFRGRLYVGSERELYRVNPDDSWDLVVGTPRKTPDGRKLEPLSGFDYGFDSFFNIHMWRMGVHGEYLYIGTQDQSTRWRVNPIVAAPLIDKMGFDLYATPDGRLFTDVSRNGFRNYVDFHNSQPVSEPDNIFNRGMRSLISTPHGLFAGSANYYYGTKIWKGEILAFPSRPFRRSSPSKERVNPRCCRGRRPRERFSTRYFGTKACAHRSSSAPPPTCTTSTRPRPNERRITITWWPSARRENSRARRT